MSYFIVYICYRKNERKKLVITLYFSIKTRTKKANHLVFDSHLVTCQLLTKMTKEKHCDERNMAFNLFSPIYRKDTEPLFHFFVVVG